MKAEHKNEITETERAALEILRSTGVDVLEAALVAKLALEAGRGRVKRAKQCIEAGEAELRKLEKTVTFEKAVEVALEARKGRRARTLVDFRYFTKRLLRLCKGLAARRVRAITAQECAEYINMAFSTPRQRQKARLILSGVFSTAIKHGWCSENPVAKVDVPQVVEQRIDILQPQEIEQLIETAKTYKNGRCLAAVGMMLYAGIRPHEVARLSWEQVDIEGCGIAILPQHSKTGGSRRVTIHPPLAALLKNCSNKQGKICPTRWLHHWHQLRRAAGFTRWTPDVLRHTFASYHLQHFRNYATLQYETGHRDSTLLRTRYVSQAGVGDAAGFWS